jgi:hypothetical protein
MFGRGSILLVLLGAAVLPYVATQLRGRDSATPATAVIGKTPLEAHVAAPPGVGAAASGPQAAGVAPRTTSHASLVPLEQALRWDVTPAWVMSTWPRVTTRLPDLELQGYRIAYVSGTAESDIAGSLSYYFDGTQRLRRISFSGSTGDARRLTQFLMSQHRFERRLGKDPSTYLYQVEEDGKALSELRIKAAPVVRTGSPLGRFEVALEIRRPE